MHWHEFNPHSSSSGIVRGWAASDSKWRFMILQVMEQYSNSFVASYGFIDDEAPVMIGEGIDRFDLFEDAEQACVDTLYRLKRLS